MGKNIFTTIAILAGITLALGGCDDKHKSETRTEDGHATITFGNTKVQVADDHASGVTLPANMPAYAAVYPGADVRAVVTTNDASMTAMITYATTAKPGDVLAFHKKNAAAAGLDMSQDVQLGGVWHFAAQKKSGDANLTVTIVAENGRYSVQETYK
ncbi:MAG: hypothetical protein KGJ78_07015 [Alphaproteobacteria bacterium]|nr:hypothetical protein [Alphaproteobacteria bacterium]